LTHFKSLLAAFSHWGSQCQSDEASVFSKAVKESWCPSCATVALLFGRDQACARIRSSCVASLT